MSDTDEKELTRMDLRGALATAIAFMRHAPDCSWGMGDPVKGPTCDCGMYQAQKEVQKVLDDSRKQP